MQNIQYYGHIFIYSAKGWTFICLPAVCTKTDGLEEEAKN